MAKKRLKNDQLAKLRQFQKGMNVEDYLFNEHRQVIRALEESYIDTSGDFNVPGLYAYKTTSISSTKDVLFEQIHIDPKFGELFSNTIFKPIKSGKYWIDASWYSASTGAGSTLKVELKSVGGNVLASRTVLGTQNIHLFTSLSENDGLFCIVTVNNVSVDNFSLKITKISD